MHHQITLDPNILQGLSGKTAIITGGAAGIGAATVKLFSSHGASVVIADLEQTRSAASAVVGRLHKPEKAMFIAANILNWQQMNNLFKQSVETFGHVDIVVANAGTIESKPVLDLDDVEADGEPKEPVEGYRVIDINLKGTLNSESGFVGPYLH